ncbi:MAG: aminotransferase class V-fold PLP-dependent enzyme [Planctomycetota bacterium]
MSDQPLIYLNHAGTSWPKPEPAIAAAQQLLTEDPLAWPDRFSRAHAKIADFFHVAPDRLLLTPSCTAALDLAISDHAWQPGDRVLTTSYEHHAVIRPLTKLERRGVIVERVPASPHGLVDLEAVESALQAGGVRMVAMTAASNVTGQLVPTAEITELAHAHGALMLVDGAQIAGWWDLDVLAMSADLFTFAGHKGPHAPWGVGGLIVAPHVTMNSPLAVCEVSGEGRCATMPGYCDAGSVNLVAVVGMEAACTWLIRSHPNRLAEARRRTAQFLAGVRELPLTLHGDSPLESRMPTVAIAASSLTTTELGKRLAASKVMVSAGFQCAAEAHQALGTDQTGVVRFSLGPTTGDDEIQATLEILRHLVG